MVFYKLDGIHHFNGEDDYIDISGKLHHFLQSRTLKLRVRFCTESAGYAVLLGIYYKESLLPDFSVNINRGYVTVTTRAGERLLVLSDRQAVNDGKEHELIVNGDEEGLRGIVDGRQIFHEKETVPYCSFGYVGFATIGRGTLEDQYAGFFKGDILELELSKEPFSSEEKAMSGSFQLFSTAAGDTSDSLKKIPLFQKNMAAVENYRIPMLLTTQRGTVIAGADARIDAPGDNPNHIARAIRISTDSGASWEEIVIPVDFGGTGREDGAAAIDGQLVQDEETGTVFMLYGHTKSGIGSALSSPGSGYDEEGHRILYGEDGEIYKQQPDGTVTDQSGNITGWQVDAYDRLYLDKKEIGSVCHGNCPLQIKDTSFLQIAESRDDGRTWSAPRDLNSQVKQTWMCFLGPGPGIGISKKKEPYQGRLVCPVYFSNAAGVYTCAAIYSDDHGTTWKMGRSVNDTRMLDGRRLSGELTRDLRALTGECQLVELDDGSLKIFIRNPYYRHAATAISRDGGECWTDFTVDPWLVNPDCQFGILKLEDDGRSRYLFSGPDHERQRVKGTVRISDDDTKSWRVKKLLEPGEFGYSCMTLLPDGTLGILYEGLGLTLYFTKFSMNWLEKS